MSTAFELPALHSFTAIPLEVTFSTFGNQPAQEHSSPRLAYDAPGSTPRTHRDPQSVYGSIIMHGTARWATPLNEGGADDLSDFSYSLSVQPPLMPTAGSTLNIYRTDANIYQIDDKVSPLTCDIGRKSVQTQGVRQCFYLKLPHLDGGNCVPIYTDQLFVVFIRGEIFLVARPRMATHFRHRGNVRLSPTNLAGELTGVARIEQ